MPMAFLAWSSLSWVVDQHFQFCRPPAMKGHLHALGGPTVDLTIVGPLAFIERGLAGGLGVVALSTAGSQANPISQSVIVADPGRQEHARMRGGKQTAQCDRPCPSRSL